LSALVSPVALLGISLILSQWRSIAWMQESHSRLLRLEKAAREHSCERHPLVSPTAADSATVSNSFQGTLKQLSK
jgi:hypothetical protein